MPDAGWGRGGWGTGPYGGNDIAVAETGLPATGSVGSVTVVEGAGTSVAVSLHGLSYLTDNNDFTSAEYNKSSGISVTADAIAGPDGQTTADLIEQTTTFGDAHLQQGFSVTPSASRQYTLTADLKQGTAATTQLYAFFTGSSTKGSQCQLTWSTLSVTSGGAEVSGAAPTAAGVIPLGDGWYRLYMTIADSNDGANTSLQWRLYPASRNSSMGSVYCANANVVDGSETAGISTGFSALGSESVTTDQVLSVTGLSATGSLGSETVTGDANVSVTGLSGSSALGSITFALGYTQETTGVSGTATVGTATGVGSAVATLTGVSSIASVGSVSVVEGVGTTEAISGFSVSSGVGSVTIYTDAILLVSLAAATGSAGSPDVNDGDLVVVYTPTGVVGAMLFGDETASGAALVQATGFGLTGSLGSETVDTTTVVSVTGPGLQSYLGDTSQTGAVVSSASGLAATASLGTPALPETVTVSGLAGTSALGSVTSTGVSVVVVSGVSVTISLGSSSVPIWSTPAANGGDAWGDDTASGGGSWSNATATGGTGWS